jgi:hypothetical protein
VVFRSHNITHTHTQRSFFWQSVSECRKFLHLYYTTALSGSDYAYNIQLGAALRACGGHVLWPLQPEEAELTLNSVLCIFHDTLCLLTITLGNVTAGTIHNVVLRSQGQILLLGFPRNPSRDFRDFSQYLRLNTGTVISSTESIVK